MNDDDDALALQQRTEQQRRQTQQHVELLEDEEAAERTRQAAMRRNQGARPAYEDSAIEEDQGRGTRAEANGSPGQVLSAGVGRRKKFILAGLALAVAAAALIFTRRQPAAEQPPALPLPVGQATPIDATTGQAAPAPGGPIAVAAAQPAAPGTAQSVKLTVTAADLPASGAISSAPPPVERKSQPAPVVEIDAGDLQTLLQNSRRTDARLSSIEADLGEVKTMLGKLYETAQAAGPARARLTSTNSPARPAPSRRPAQRVVAKAVSMPAPVAPVEDRSDARLLSVDVWDGRPSVALTSSAPGDRRVRFLTEGDSNAGVVLRSADPRAQRAVFDVAGREVVLERQER